MSPGRPEAALWPIAQPAPLRELLAWRAGPDSTGDPDRWALTSEGGRSGQTQGWPPMSALAPAFQTRRVSSAMFPEDGRCGGLLRSLAKMAMAGRWAAEEARHWPGPW